MKKEARLRQELRMIGLTTSELAIEFNVSVQTVNNWISGRIFIPPKSALKLQEKGIPKTAIRNPSEMV